MSVIAGQTRFKELAFTQVATKAWRFVDAETQKCVGPAYATKGEMMADLPRYARDSWGLE